MIKNPSEHHPLLDAVLRIGQEVAAAHADDVDVRARFPQEAISALRRARVFSAAVPSRLGGCGMGVAALTRMCALLGQHCSATAMIVAMHHIQVATIANHDADVPEVAEYLRLVVEQQRLIASVTSEVGPGGDLRQSVAAVSTTGDGFSLTKRATTISYGAHADDLLISARRHGEARPNDQVLVLAMQGRFQLDSPGVWDTLGMRGTCSPGATVTCSGQPWQVLPTPFSHSASRSMIPYSHLLWSGVWLGIATEAVRRARKLARAKARNAGGQTPPNAQHLSDVVAKLQLLRTQVESAAVRHEELSQNAAGEALDEVGYALEINNLKLCASEMVAEICADVMRISGIAAYTNQGEFSCGRLLRDAHSAAVMVNNYRLRQTNASWLMVHKGAALSARAS